jgi:hypothetical protein
MDGAPIDWAERKRTVNRQGIRAFTGAILAGQNDGQLIIRV